MRKTIVNACKISGLVGALVLGGGCTTTDELNLLGLGMRGIAINEPGYTPEQRANANAVSDWAYNSAASESRGKNGGRNQGKGISGGVLSYSKKKDEWSYFDHQSGLKVVWEKEGSLVYQDANNVVRNIPPGTKVVMEK